MPEFRWHGVSALRPGASDRLPTVAANCGRRQGLPVPFERCRTCQAGPVRAHAHANSEGAPGIQRPATIRKPGSMSTARPGRITFSSERIQRPIRSTRWHLTFPPNTLPAWAPRRRPRYIRRPCRIPGEWRQARRFPAAGHYLRHPRRCPEPATVRPRPAAPCP